MDNEKDEFAKALGAELARLRLATPHPNGVPNRPMSRNALAKIIGCSRDEIAAYEKGKVIPSGWRQEQIRRALGVREITV